MGKYEKCELKSYFCKSLLFGNVAKWKRIQFEQIVWILLPKVAVWQWSKYLSDISGSLPYIGCKFYNTFLIPSYGIMVSQTIYWHIDHTMFWETIRLLNQFPQPSSQHRASSGGYNWTLARESVSCRILVPGSRFINCLVLSFIVFRLSWCCRDLSAAAG